MPPSQPLIRPLLPAWDSEMEVVFEAGHPSWDALLTRTNGVPGIYGFMVGETVLRIGESAAKGNTRLSGLAHRLDHHLQTAYGKRSPVLYPDYLAFFSTLLGERLRVAWRRFDGSHHERRALEAAMIERQPVLWESLEARGPEGHRGDVRAAVIQFLERTSIGATGERRGSR